MNLLDDLPLGVRVGVDTSLFIYYLEAHPTFGPLVMPLFTVRIGSGDNLAVTSVVTLAETLVKPLVQGRADLVRAYRHLLTRAPHVTLFAVTRVAAARAADLRARFGIRLADAFQVAVCLERGATYFVTNDAALRRVTDLTVLILSDYLPPPTP